MRALCKPSLVAVCAAIAAALLAPSSDAAAATMQLTVGAEPVESVTTQLGATVAGGTRGEEVWLHTKSTGGASCAVNPYADEGEEVLAEELDSEASPVDFSRNHTFQKAGTYELCGWLTAGGHPEEVIAHTETTITVRLPHLSLAVTVPASVSPQQAFQISTTAQAETAREVWEYMLPSTGDGCAANAVAAEDAPGVQTILAEWDVIGGPATETKDYSLTKPGTYLVCAYFEYPNIESVPELTASATTAVLAPPPPCIVPALASHTRLDSAEQTIRAASCTVGKVTYVASTVVPRGDVVSLSQASGEKLAHGAAVAIVVSSGRPCVVPPIKRLTGLRRAERQLAAADCIASIVYVRSHSVPRGHVLRVGVRPYTRLHPRAKVRLFISAGHS